MPKNYDVAVTYYVLGEASCSDSDERTKVNYDCDPGHSNVCKCLCESSLRMKLLEAGYA